MTLSAFHVGPQKSPDKAFMRATMPPSVADSRTSNCSGLVRLPRIR